MADDTGNFFDHKRLQGFNDAVFSIVSTILVLPVRKLEFASDKESLRHQVDDKWPQLLVYLTGFLVIAAVWESHVLRFRLFSRVDDVLIWLNLASLLFTSFLPFTCALVGTFPRKFLPMLLISANLLMLEILETIMIAYVFHHHDILVQELKELPEEERKKQRNNMLLKKLVNPVLYVLAALLSLAYLPIAWALMLIVILTPCTNRLIGNRMFGGHIDKERVEFFSDGVFAIVSTLLILDITAENFPSKHEVAEKGIQATLKGMHSQFLTYGGTFVMVALLCFVHHSLLHCIKKMNQLMLICNNISLAFVGLAPLISAILDVYAGHGNRDSQLAVQISTAFIFMASVMQVVLFLVALWLGRNSLDPCGHPRLAPHAHNYLVSKLAIIPCVTMLVFFAGFANPSITDDIYHISVGLTPLIFILFKALYVWWNRHLARLVLQEALHDEPDAGPTDEETPADDVSTLNASGVV